MNKLMKRSALLIMALILCISVFSLVSCGGKEGGENDGLSLKKYSIAVEKGMELGNITAEAKKTDSQGTHYEIAVTPKTGYAVKKFVIGGVEAPLTDNKVNVILNSDTSISVEYQRKTSEELTKRQDMILAKMDQYTGTLFKYDKDYTYVLNGNKIVLKQGVLHGGLPYTAYDSISPDVFLEYAVSKDQNGVYTMSFPSGNDPFYWGGSCGNAAFWAWAAVSSTIKFSYSADMIEKFGAYTVGYFAYNTEEDIKNDTWQDTKTVCDNNGVDVMCEAYALLCRADAVQYKSTETNGHPAGNHVMIVTDVIVVRGQDGKISPERSFIKYQDQNGGYMTKVGKENKNVYSSCAYSGQMSFREMFDYGYLPMTCIELLDDSTPLAKAEIKDSLDSGSYNALNVTRGYVDSNYAITKVVMEITAANGNSVFKGTRHGLENSPTRLPLSTFTTTSGQHNQPNVYPTAFDGNSLAAGEYKCVVTAYVSSGENVVVRDFTFTK